jgi:thiol-disulfide isomerase/thioredoxin
MSKFSRKVELTANIIFVVATVFLVGILVQRYFFAKPRVNQPAFLVPTIGKQVNLPDENWSAQPKTLILALQTTCHFCDESASFYKRLVETTKNKNVKIVAVFPQSVAEATAHLSQLGIGGVEVKQAPISALNTFGTPTLIITNQKGEVVKYWIGKLTDDQEVEVVNEVNS